MCTALDPEYNPWRELQPYTEILIARGFGINVSTEARNATLSLPNLQTLVTGDGGKALRALGEQVVKRTLSPVTRTDTVMQRLESGDIHVVAEMTMAHRQQLRRIERESRRTSRSVFVGSVLIASTLLYINGDITLAIIGAVVILLTMFFGMLKD
jgi:hypothetical protein